jgi:hypothetical protein
VGGDPFLGPNGAEPNAGTLHPRSESREEESGQLDEEPRTLRERFPASKLDRDHASDLCGLRAYPLHPRGWC